MFSPILFMSSHALFRRICNPAALSISICDALSCGLQILILVATGLQIPPSG
jgi:hypothetical protein